MDNFRAKNGFKAEESPADDDDNDDDIHEHNWPMSLTNLPSIAFPQNCKDLKTWTIELFSGAHSTCKNHTNSHTSKSSSRGSFWV